MATLWIFFLLASICVTLCADYIIATVHLHGYEGKREKMDDSFLEASHHKASVRWPWHILWKDSLFFTIGFGSSYMTHWRIVHAVILFLKSGIPSLTVHNDPFFSESSHCVRFQRGFANFTHRKQYWPHNAMLLPTTFFKGLLFGLTRDFMLILSFYWFFLRHHSFSYATPITLIPHLPSQRAFLNSVYGPLTLVPCIPYSLTCKPHPLLFIFTYLSSILV